MLPSSPAPDFFGKFKKLKTLQKNAKKIMHVPDHGPHHREKFRTEMSSYAPWGKMTKFWQEIQNFGSHMLSEIDRKSVV